MAAVLQGQDEGGALALGRADGAEDVGRGGALIAGRGGARAAAGPSAGDLVLLSDPGFILEPDLYGLPLEASRARSAPGSRRSFFKIRDHAFVLGMMARARRQLAEAHGAKLPAHRLLRDREPELLPNPLHQINDAPAHHAMHRRDRAALDNPRERRALVANESAGCPAPCRSPARPAPGVESQHPVPDDLQPNAADLAASVRVPPS